MPESFSRNTPSMGDRLRREQFFLLLLRRPAPRTSSRYLLRLLAKLTIQLDFRPSVRPGKGRRLIASRRDQYLQGPPKPPCGVLTRRLRASTMVGEVLLIDHMSRMDVESSDRTPQNINRAVVSNR